MTRKHAPHSAQASNLSVSPAELDTDTYRAHLDLQMPEGDLLERIRQLARLQGFRTYHTLRSRGSEPGFPDLLIARADVPVVYAWELKTQRGRATAEQFAWLQVLQGRRIESAIVRPSEWPAIERLLTGEKEA